MQRSAAAEGGGAAEVAACRSARALVPEEGAAELGLVLPGAAAGGGPARRLTLCRHARTRFGDLGVVLLGNRRRKRGLLLVGRTRPAMLVRAALLLTAGLAAGLTTRLSLRLAS